MSAQADYTNHIRNRYRMDAPAQEKIRWQMDKMRLLKLVAMEDPSKARWVREEEAGVRQHIAALRAGDA